MKRGKFTTSAVLSLLVYTAPIALFAAQDDVYTPRGFFPVQVVEYEFETDAEEWQAISVPSFDSPFFGSGLDTLRLLTPSANSFGYWISPAINDMVSLRGDTGSGNRVRRSYFTLLSDLPNPATAPTIRLRMNTSDLQASHLVVATSAGDGAYSPGGTARDYELFFDIPPGVSSYNLSYDILNFDPADSINSPIYLDRVRVETFHLVTGQTTLFLQNFEGTAGGWTFRDASPAFAAPAAASTAAGLSVGGPPVPSGSTIYGSWASPEGDPPIVLNGGSVYDVHFVITTSAPPAEVNSIPTIRFRANTTNLQFSALHVVESTGGHTLPSERGSELYSLTFVAPEELDGQGLLLAMDYLVAPGDGNSGSIAVTLESVEIRELMYIQ